MPTSGLQKPLTLSEQERMNMQTNSVYGFDRTGKHPDNLVTKEQHLIKRPDGSRRKSIVLKHGAFYTEERKVAGNLVSLVVRDISDPANPKVLVKAMRDPGTMELVTSTDPDYYCSESSHVVASLTGKEACYNIVLLGDKTPDMLEVDYSVVGGMFMHLNNMSQNILNNLTQDEVCYDQIFNVPARMKPAPHGHSLLDTYKWEFLVEAIDRLNRTIELSHTPAYIALTKKVCEMIANGLKAKPSFRKMVKRATALGASIARNKETQNVLSPFASDDYVSKSEMIMMLKEHQARGFTKMGARTLTLSKIVSVGTNDEYHFDFINNASYLGGDTLGIEIASTREHALLNPIKHTDNISLPVAPFLRIEGFAGATNDYPAVEGDYFILEEDAGTKIAGVYILDSTLVLNRLGDVYHDDIVLVLNPNSFKVTVPKSKKIDPLKMRASVIGSEGEELLLNRVAPINSL